MDDNIDTNLDNINHNNEVLLGMLNDHLSKNSIVHHNYDNTRYMIGQKPSSIDHIYSNCPSNLNNIITHDYMVHDHKLLTFQYNCISQIHQSKFVCTKSQM